MATGISGDTGVDKIAPAALDGFFGGSNQLLSSDGYQKFPNGLILQWGLTGTTVDGGTAVTVTFPIPFTTAVFHVSYMKSGAINGNGTGDDRVGTITLSAFQANAGTLAGDNFYFAIGY